MKKRPSTGFLVTSHTLLLLALLTIRVSSWVSLMFSLFVFVSLLVISLLIQGLVHLIIRKRQVAPWFRIPLYYAPVMLFVILSLVLPKLPQKPNQTSPFPSPSQNYVLKVPIEKGAWTVTIEDHQGKVIYKDMTSDFLGHFNSYWYWDKDDRVWFYNSDNGRVYFWENTPDGWKKSKWGYGHTKQTGRDLTPPIEMYPRYAKEITEIEKQLKIQDQQKERIRSKTFQLKHRKPTELSKALQKHIDKQEYNGDEAKLIYLSYSILTDDSAMKLVITGIPEAIKEMEIIINELDVPERKEKTHSEKKQKEE